MQHNDQGTTDYDIGNDATSCWTQLGKGVCQDTTTEISVFSRPTMKQRFKTTNEPNDKLQADQPLKWCGINTAKFFDMAVKVKTLDSNGNGPSCN